MMALANLVASNYLQQKLGARSVWRPSPNSFLHICRLESKFDTITDCKMIYYR